MAEIAKNLIIYKEDEHIPSTIEKSSHRTMTIIDPDDLIGRTFLAEPKNDGDRERLTVVEVMCLFSLDYTGSISWMLIN